MATPVGLLAGKGDKQEEPWPNKSASPPTTMLLTQNFFRSFFFCVSLLELEARSSRAGVTDGNAFRYWQVL